MLQSTGTCTWQMNITYFYCWKLLSIASMWWTVAFLSERRQKPVLMENNEGNRNNEGQQSANGDNGECTTKESDEDKQPAARWTTRKKLVGVSLCIVLFTAMASLSIIAPFFPNEVSWQTLSSCFMRFSATPSLVSRIPFSSCRFTWT